jgi:hypothetical protein
MLHGSPTSLRSWDGTYTCPGNSGAAVTVSGLQERNNHSGGVGAAIDLGVNASIAGSSSSTRPDSLNALTVATTAAETRQLESGWAKRNIPIPLGIVDAPHRDIAGPVLRYLAGLRER